MISSSHFLLTWTLLSGPFLAHGCWIAIRKVGSQLRTELSIRSTAGPIVGLVGMGLDFSQDPGAKLAAAGCHATDGICGLVGFGTAIAAAIDA